MANVDKKSGPGESPPAHRISIDTKMIRSQTWIRARQRRDVLVHVVAVMDDIHGIHDIITIHIAGFQRAIRHWRPLIDIFVNIIGHKDDFHRINDVVAIEVAPGIAAIADLAAGFHAIPVADPRLVVCAGTVPDQRLPDGYRDFVRGR